jgi:hypothetical protein
MDLNIASLHACFSRDGEIRERTGAGEHWNNLPPEG